MNQTSSTWDVEIYDVENSPDVSLLVEGIVVNHVRRHHPTYYLKAQQEVDVAYVQNRKIFPVEVKWTNQLRADELQHLRKYPSARVVAKTDRRQERGGITFVSIPEFLLSLG